MSTFKCHLGGSSDKYHVSGQGLSSSQADNDSHTADQLHYWDYLGDW